MRSSDQEGRSVLLNQGQGRLTTKLDPFLLPIKALSTVATIKQSRPKNKLDQIFIQLRVSVRWV